MSLQSFSPWSISHFWTVFFGSNFWKLHGFNSSLYQEAWFPTSGEAGLRRADILASRRRKTSSPKWGVFQSDEFVWNYIATSSERARNHGRKKRKNTPWNLGTSFDTLSNWTFQVWNAPTWFLSALSFALCALPYCLRVLATQKKEELRRLLGFLGFWGDVCWANFSVKKIRLRIDSWTSLRRTLVILTLLSLVPKAGPDRAIGLSLGLLLG